MNKLLLDFNSRRQLFESFIKDSKLIEKSFTCPSCGFPTLTERHSWEICSICNWEDDGQDDANANEIFGGPNGGMSLTESRIEFQKEFDQYLLDENRRLIKDGAHILKSLKMFEEDFEKIVDSKTNNEAKIFEKWAQLNELLFKSLTEKNAP